MTSPISNATQTVQKDRKILFSISSSLKNLFNKVSKVFSDTINFMFFRSSTSGQSAIPPQTTSETWAPFVMPDFDKIDQDFKEAREQGNRLLKMCEKASNSLKEIEKTHEELRNNDVELDDFLNKREISYLNIINKGLFYN